MRGRRKSQPGSDPSRKALLVEPTYTVELDLDFPRFLEAVEDY
jgi:hypothetical protein